MSLSARVFVELMPLKKVPAHDLIHAIFGHINAVVFSMGTAQMGSRLRGNDEGGAGITWAGLDCSRLLVGCFWIPAFAGMTRGGGMTKRKIHCNLPGIWTKHSGKERQFRRVASCTTRPISAR